MSTNPTREAQPSATPRTDAEVYGPLVQIEDEWVPDFPFVEADFARTLETELQQANARERDLKDWKTSALDLLNKIDLQAIGKELNLPLGSDIASAILPSIRALKARLDSKQPSASLAPQAKPADGLPASAL